MCRHQESSEQSGSYTTLSNILWLNRALCGITWQFNLLGKKENDSAEKDEFLSLSLFLPPPSCQKQGKWKHIRYNPDRLCTMIPVVNHNHYTLLCCKVVFKNNIVLQHPSVGKPNLSKVSNQT